MASTSELLADHNNKPSHIPAHLPNFPPPHTYSSTNRKHKSSKSKEQQDLKDKTLTKNSIKSIQTTLSKIACCPYYLHIFKTV